MWAAAWVAKWFVSLRASSAIGSPATAQWPSIAGPNTGAGSRYVTYLKGAIEHHLEG